MATDAGPIVATERRGAVAIAHLNRPELQNALTPSLMDRIGEMVSEWDSDPGVRCIVIAGSQKVFASGADVELAQAGAAASLDGAWSQVRDCSTPLVAAVSGFALGAGWELALTCDLVVAGDNAEFGHPEIQLGLIPGGGGTQLLTRAIGKQRAMELVLTGKRITAEEAFELGLVNTLSGTRDWFETAVELAQVVAARPPEATRLAKQAVLTAEETTLAGGIAEERRLRRLAATTEDHIEALQALLERRRPEFKDR